MHLSVEGVEEETGAASFADLVASLYIAAYIVVLLEPFVLLGDLPGSAAWAGLPLLGLLALVLAPRDRLIRVPVSASILALAVWSAASIAWSDRFGASFFAIRSEVPSLILLCLVVGSMPRTNVVRTLLWVFAGVGVWSLTTSLTMPMSRIAYVDEGPTLTIQDGWRGTFIHKNLLGVFALLGFTTTLAFVRHRGVKSAMLGLFVVLVLGSRSATVASGIVVAPPMGKSGQHHIVRTDSRGLRRKRTGLARSGLSGNPGSPARKLAHVDLFQGAEGAIQSRYQCALPVRAKRVRHRAAPQRQTWPTGDDRSSVRDSDTRQHGDRRRLPHSAQHHDGHPLHGRPDRCPGARTWC